MYNILLCQLWDSSKRCIQRHVTSRYSHDVRDYCK